MRGDEFGEELIGHDFEEVVVGDGFGQLGDLQLEAGVR